MFDIPGLVSVCIELSEQWFGRDPYCIVFQRWKRPAHVPRLVPRTSWSLTRIRKSKCRTGNLGQRGHDAIIRHGPELVREADSCGGPCQNQIGIIVSWIYVNVMGERSVIFRLHVHATTAREDT